MDGIVCRAIGGPAAAIITVTCPLEGPTAAGLIQAVRDRGAADTRWIVFDLRAGASLDSRAIGALLLAHRVCARNHGWVTLLGPSASTRSLLDAIGIADLFQVSDDRDQLMAELASLAAPHRKGRL